MVVILWNNVKMMSHLILTLCLLGSFHDFLLSADFFQNQFLKKKFFPVYYQCQNSLDPESGQMFFRA